MARKPKEKDLSNQVSNPIFSPFRMFSDAQLQELHHASLEILRRTGVNVYEPQAVRLLEEAGCWVEGSRVRIPAGLVEEMLHHVPSRVTLCDRTGKPSLFLEGSRSYFGTGSDLPYTRDLDSGKRRLSLLADVENTARLVDALPNIDFVMSMALPSNVNQATADRHAFYAMATNTTKPICFTAWDTVSLQDILDMAEIIAGSRSALHMNPFVVAYLEPVSPLQHAREVVQKIFLMADYGLPFVYSPGGITGGTMPMTPAGSLVQANAEVLSGMVITQLYRKGTPFIWGSGSGPLDMRTMANIYTGPEAMLHSIGITELGQHFYHVPVWGFAGCSDSKLPDTQAGAESALFTLTSALSGANLVHDVGYIESGMTCSYEMIVINNDIIGQTRRLMQGMQITPETLALDVIDQIGPGGHYLEHAHTLQHCREIWYPKVFDWHNHNAWEEKGMPTAHSNARALAFEIIHNHKPEPLAEEKMSAIRAILDAADLQFNEAKST